jgi:hypothetical protein
MPIEGVSFSTVPGEWPVDLAEIEARRAKERHRLLWALKLAAEYQMLQRVPGRPDPSWLVFACDVIEEAEGKVP